MEEAQMYLLPEEMLVLVFLRLSVKSLMRSRFVCKLWYRIISSSSFIKAQKKTAVSNTNSAYLLCTHGSKSYSLICKEELTTYRKYYYKPESFEIDQKKYINEGPMVYGSCNGLLCISEPYLHIHSSVYLLNPIIRKVKKIPRIPIEVDKFLKFIDLCFGYFDDDYKVIIIAPLIDTYRVGVYSLSMDSWKIIHCGSTYEDLYRTHIYDSSICVGGVAYFVKYTDRLPFFDLHDEKIREVKYPESPWTCESLGTFYSVEALGESLALLQMNDAHLDMWALKYCRITNTTTWEKRINVDLQGAGHNRLFIRLGFTTSGTYVLSDFYNSTIYLGDLETLWDRRIVQLKDITCDEEANAIVNNLQMYPLVANLVLVNEETLDSFVETKPCSTDRHHQRRAKQNMGLNRFHQRRSSRIYKKKNRRNKRIIRFDL